MLSKEQIQMLFLIRKSYEGVTIPTTINFFNKSYKKKVNHDYNNFL